MHMPKAGLPVAALVAVAAAVVAAVAAAPQTPGINFPAGYRNWTHLKTMLIHDKAHPLYEAFGGIHHVYVNARGAEAARRGGPYPDGSVLAFDLLQAKEEGGAWVEGQRKVLAVMVKDARRYASTGGWGWQAWGGGEASKPVVTDAAQQCFACHEPQKAADYVFSKWRP